MLKPGIAERVQPALIRFNVSTRTSLSVQCMLSMVSSEQVIRAMRASNAAKGLAS